jgi:chemotaxis protein histidine kinase CheA
MADDIADDELRALRDDYLADVREMASVIRKHGLNLGRKGDFKTSFPVLLYLSHQLKGSGGSLGFPQISIVARRMNEQLNEFLDEETGMPRPTRAELAHNMVSLAEELDRLAVTTQV